MSTSTKQSETLHLQQVLKFTFGLLAIAAGADKFMNLLVDWEMYVHPSVAEMLPFSASAFMMVVGIIEIIAGILVFAKTRLGAYIVSAWLLLIALSLIFSGFHFDVAVRDIVMSISAWGLAKLTEITDRAYDKA